MVDGGLSLIVGGWLIIGGWSLVVDVSLVMIVGKTPHLELMTI